MEITIKGDSIPLNNPSHKGHWVKHEKYYDCSECACIALRDQTAIEDLWKLTKFCPDCGADMRDGNIGWYRIDGSKFSD